MQEILNSLKSKSIPYDKDDFMVSLQAEFPNYNVPSEHTIYELINMLCDDKGLQKQVYDKLVAYTSQSKVYISGEHLKPKYFYEFVQVLKKFISDPQNEDDDDDDDDDDKNNKDENDNKDENNKDENDNKDENNENENDNKDENNDDENNEDVNNDDENNDDENNDDENNDDENNDDENNDDENEDVDEDNYSKTIGYNINFVLHLEEDQYERSDIWASSIIDKKGIKCATTPGSLYDYQDIFFKSIAGSVTINELGVDGFIAALLTFCHWDMIWEKPKSLQEMCMEKYVNLINECKNEEDIKKIMGTLHQDITFSSHFRSKLTKEKQMLLFHEYDDGDGYVVVYDENGNIKMKKWYVYVFWKFIIKTIEFTKEGVTRTIIFNKDLEEIGFEDTNFGKLS